MSRLSPRMSLFPRKSVRLYPTVNNLPVYITPHNTICSACMQSTRVVPLNNSFSYSGTHCTGGVSGVHQPDGYGDPVSYCCEAVCLHNGVELEREDMEVYEVDDL